MHLGGHKDSITSTVVIYEPTDSKVGVVLLYHSCTTTFLPTKWWHCESSHALWPHSLHEYNLNTICIPSFRISAIMPMKLVSILSWYSITHSQIACEILSLTDAFKSTVMTTLNLACFLYLHDCLMYSVIKMLFGSVFCYVGPWQLNVTSSFIQFILIKTADKQLVMTNTRSFNAFFGAKELPYDELLS